MALPIGFEQDPEAPEGAGLFHFDTGKSVYAYEPEEARLVRERLTSAPDPRIAGQVVDPWYDDPEDPVSRETGQSIPAPAPNEPLPIAAPPRGQPPPTAAPPTTTDVVSAAREQTRRQAAEELLHGKVVSTPGRNPVRERETGVMVPRGSTTVTEGAVPYDPEMAKQRVEADKKVLDVQLAGLDQQEQALRAQSAQAAAMQPELERRAAEAQSYRARAIEGFRQKRAALDDDLREYEASARPDPGRYWKNKGIFGGIGMVIAQALGAYASILGRTPNWTFEAMQRGIDRDIESQKEEIRSGRISRENALARFTQMYGGDVDQAEEAVRMAQMKLAQNETLRYGAESGIPQVQQQAQMLAAEMERQIINREQKWFNDHMGKSTTTVAQEFVQPRAGGAGRRPLTDAETAARQKILGSEGLSDMPAAKRVNLQTDYGKRKQDVLEARHEINELSKTYGLRVNWDTGEVVDPRTGKVIDPEQWEGISGHGATGWVPNMFTSKAGRDVRAQQLKSIMAYKKAVTGMAATVQEAKDTRQVIVGEFDADALTGLQRMVGEVADKDRELDSTYPGEVVHERERRQREVKVERKQRGATTPTKVTPYGE